MTTCLTGINFILDNEFIGNSLNQINNNFSQLQSSVCDLQVQLDTTTNIRTFFYYGPNAAVDPNSGVQNNSASYPSNVLIENFVNSQGQFLNSGLNLPSISQIGDVAYVIYQKTGWFQPTPTVYTRTGGGSVPFSRVETYTVRVTRKIGICFAPGTYIQTPFGDKAIETLKVGDIVYSYDPINKNKVEAEIEKTYKQDWNNDKYKEISPLLVILHEKGKLEVTGDHWIYMGQDKQPFKAAKELLVGDFVILETGVKSKILNIKQKQECSFVYNLYIKKYHNFIANGVITGDYKTDDFVKLLKKEALPEEINSVATPQGFKNIKDLKVGDEVYGYDHITLDLVKQRVEQILKHKTDHIKIVHEHGEVTIPINQKLLINNSYKAAKSIKIGDFLTILENTKIYTPFYDTKSKILKIEKIKEQKATELVITNTHNYILDNVFVHNKTRRETRTRIVTQYVSYSWTEIIEDRYNNFNPVYFVYRLIYNGARYEVQSGYPKFSYSLTSSTNNWNKPEMWTTY